MLGRRRQGVSELLAITVILLLCLVVVTISFVDTTQTDSSQIATQNQQIASLKAELRQLAAHQNSTSAYVASIAQNLPAVDQKPTVRVITVEWAEFLSLQDRFFTNFIIVNQGDTVDVTFISNDTASHTFTIDQPYNFQINGSVPGTVDDPTGQTFTTQPTNDSPGVSCTPESRPGNVTCNGAFKALYPGVYEYYCIYHIHLGMFGYLVVLPNKAASQTVTTTSTTTILSGSIVHIPLGSGSSTNPIGFTPQVIRVVLGVNSTVTWVNDDSIDHTVTSLTGVFNSQIIPPGGSFSFTFTSTGNYTYGCEFHPLMRGTVLVLPSSGG